jgi:hypothetical protein
LARTARHAGHLIKRALRTFHIAHEKQAIETLRMIFRGQQAAKLRPDAGLSRRIARRFHPSAAQRALRAGFIRASGSCLGTWAGRACTGRVRAAPRQILQNASRLLATRPARQSLCMAERSRKAARWESAEMRQHQRIICWAAESGFCPARDGIHQGPIGIVTQKADKFSRRCGRGSMREAHPQYDLPDQRISGGGIGIRFRPTRTIGCGDGGLARSDARSLG